MAYAFNVTRSEFVEDGIRYLVLDIVETEVGVASIWEADIPSVFTMTLFDASLTDPATATEINPILFYSSNGTGPFDPLVENDDTAAEWVANPSRVRNATSVRGATGGRKLRGQSRPDATANEIRTQITLARGHI